LANAGNDNGQGVDYGSGSEIMLKTIFNRHTSLSLM
ncbi:hypothetical protein EC991775_4178, partial [Escherichia coli 99.1775]